MITVLHFLVLFRMSWGYFYSQPLICFYFQKANKSYLLCLWWVVQRRLDLLGTSGWCSGCGFHHNKRADSLTRCLSASVRSSQKFPSEEITQPHSSHHGDILPFQVTQWSRKKEGHGREHLLAFSFTVIHGQSPWVVRHLTAGSNA